MKFIGDEKDRATWSAHFIQVKSKIVQPKRSHKVKVATRKGSSYTYSYADLADVDKAVMDACKQVTDKDGNVLFGYDFDTDDIPEGYIGARTLLIDASGLIAITATVCFKSTSSNAQDTASLLSYAKRYSLSAAFGIASEDDDDAQSLKRAPQPATVSVLSQQELDNYEVRVYGKKYLLKDIWTDYLENHDGETIHWLIQQKDPQTKQAIKQLLDQYKLEQSIDQIKESESEMKPVKVEQTSKPEPKVNEQDTNEIKQLVDSNDTSSNESSEQNLFDVF